MGRTVLRRRIGDGQGKEREMQEWCDGRYLEASVRCIPAQSFTSRGPGSSLNPTTQPSPACILPDSLVIDSTQSLASTSYSPLHSDIASSTEMSRRNDSKQDTKNLNRPNSSSPRGPENHSPASSNSFDHYKPAIDVKPELDSPNALHCRVDSPNTTYPPRDHQSGLLSHDEEHPSFFPPPTAFNTPVIPPRDDITPFASAGPTPSLATSNPQQLGLDIHSTPHLIPEIRYEYATPTDSIHTATPITITPRPARDDLAIPTESASRKRQRVIEFPVDIPDSGSTSNLIVERNNPKMWKWIIKELHDMCLRREPGTEGGLYRVESNLTCTILHPTRGDVAVAGEDVGEMMDLLYSLSEETAAYITTLKSEPSITGTGPPHLYGSTPIERTKKREEVELTDDAKTRQMGIAKYVVRLSPITDNRARISQRLAQVLWDQGSTLEYGIIKVGKFLVDRALQEPRRIAALSPSPFVVDDAAHTGTPSTFKALPPDDIVPGPFEWAKESTLVRLIGDPVWMTRFEKMGSLLLAYRELVNTLPLSQFRKRLEQTLLPEGMTAEDTRIALSDAKLFCLGYQELPVLLRLRLAKTPLLREPDRDLWIRLRRSLYSRWRKSVTEMMPTELDEILFDGLLTNGASHELAVRIIREFRHQLRDSNRMRGRYGSLPGITRRHLGHIGPPEPGDPEVEARYTWPYPSDTSSSSDGSPHLLTNLRPSTPDSTYPSSRVCYHSYSYPSTPTHLYIQPGSSTFTPPPGSRPSSSHPLFPPGPIVNLQPGSSTFYPPPTPPLPLGGRPLNNLPFSPRAVSSPIPALGAAKQIPLKRPRSNSVDRPLDEGGDEKGKGKGKAKGKGKGKGTGKEKGKEKEKEKEREKEKVNDSEVEDEQRKGKRKAWKGKDKEVIPTQHEIVSEPVAIPRLDTLDEWCRLREGVRLASYKFPAIHPTECSPPPPPSGSCSDK